MISPRVQDNKTNDISSNLTSEERRSSLTPPRQLPQNTSQTIEHPIPQRWSQRKSVSTGSYYQVNTPNNCTSNFGEFPIRRCCQELTKVIRSKEDRTV